MMMMLLLLIITTLLLTILSTAPLISVAAAAVDDASDSSSLSSSPATSSSTSSSSETLTVPVIISNDDDKNIDERDCDCDNDDDDDGEDVCVDGAVDSAGDATGSEEVSSSSMSSKTPRSPAIIPFSIKGGGTEVNAIIDWIRAMKDGYVAPLHIFRIDELDIDTKIQRMNPTTTDTTQTTTKTHNKKKEKYNAEHYYLNPDYQFYATTTIPKDDILMTIPQEAFIGFPFVRKSSSTTSTTTISTSSDSSSSSSSASSSYQNKNTKKNNRRRRMKLSSCQTIQDLVNEYIPSSSSSSSSVEEEEEIETQTEDTVVVGEGNTTTITNSTSSNTNPYLEFIFGIGNPSGKQPNDWSKQGQYILWGILGEDVLQPTQDNCLFTYAEDCNRLNYRHRRSNNDYTIDEIQELESNGYLYYKKHSWGTTLFPLFDLLNHRNGKWKNVDAKLMEVTEIMSTTTIEMKKNVEEVKEDEDEDDSNSCKGNEDKEIKTTTSTSSTTTTTMTTTEVVVSMKDRKKRNDPFERYDDDNNDDDDDNNDDDDKRNKEDKEVDSNHNSNDTNNDSNDNADKDEYNYDYENEDVTAAAAVVVNVTTTTTTIITNTYYKLVVYASREIQKGEQLYTSHNQCDHLGCGGTRRTSTRTRTRTSQNVENSDDTPLHVRPSFNNNKFDDACSEMRLSPQDDHGQGHGQIQHGQNRTASCYQFQESFSIQHILADFGYVEQYPRRFFIDTDVPKLDDVDESEGYEMIFDIDRIDKDDVDDDDDDNGTLSFHWVSTSPLESQLFVNRFIETQLDRMYILENELKTAMLATLNSKYECTMITELLNAYKEAFELAYLHRYHIVNNDNENNDSTTSMNPTTPTTTIITTGKGVKVQTTQTQDMNHSYDPLIEAKGIGTVYNMDDWMTCAAGQIADNGDLMKNGHIQTFYQELEFWEETDVENTYLLMSNWLHSSSNFRAHYHEAAIHVPLQYIKDVKRVVYIGGGDNMILPELLKYPTIELIVGMELDQQASRSSLKYFGTTPEFHDPRVEWWYGDASKSLKIIPEEYFGSFDLVLVDLLSFVADTIKVVADLSIMDVATLLMNDGGVIARNEDYLQTAESTKMMTNRLVEYNYWDVPRLCELAIVLGSNSVNFFDTERYDHGIETRIRLQDFNDDAFIGWSKYHDRSNTKTDTTNPRKCETIRGSSSDAKKAPSVGFLMIIEAENVTLALENNMPEITKRITHVIIENDLTVWHEKSDRNAIIFNFDGGYIKTILFPNVHYVAFDLMMWDSFDKAEAIKESLIRSVGGNQKESTSSFQVVTCGISGLKNRRNQNNGLLNIARKTFCGGSDEDDKEVNNDTTHIKEDVEPAVSIRDDTPHDDGNTNLSRHSSSSSSELLLSDQSNVIHELVKGFIPDIIESSSSSSSSRCVYAILCGKENTACTSLDSFLSSNSTNDVSFHSINSCESFDDVHGCELMMQKRLHTVVVENEKRLDGIIIDRSVTLEMGKIVHKIFNYTVNQETLLERSYTIISPVKKEESWRNVLLDRFRTEMVITYPMHRTDIELYNETHRDEWCIIAVKINRFYDHLHKALTSIKERTGLFFTVKETQVGAIPLEFEFQPESPKDSDFYNPQAEEQWRSQKPVAYQVLLQMKLVPPLAPLTVNEIVLVASEETHSNQDGWVNLYLRAKIESIHNHKYTVKMFSQELSDGRIHTPQGHKYPIDRTLIRKFSTKEKKEFNMGDWVFINTKDEITQEDLNDSYYTGMVVAVTNEGVTVRFHDIETDVSDSEAILPETLIIVAESPEFIERISPLNASQLEEALEHTLGEMGVPTDEDDDDLYLDSFFSGDGLVLTVIWSKGNAILKWDGVDGVELNIFQYEENVHFAKDFEDVFLEKFEYLKLVAKDSFPRGYGKVVNFQHEMKDYTPHWFIKNTTNVINNLLEDDKCNEDDDEYDCIDHN